jgi:4-amino-4-deoxy-L-arabinose transferase-like glycosyltransferase
MKYLSLWAQTPLQLRQERPALTLDGLLSGPLFWGLLLAGLVFVYLPGLFIPLMDSDSAHHANIALHMLLQEDYLSLIDRGQPYLDKPHLLFWLSAASFKLFGITAFAYKFPSFLFSLLGVYATYRIARLLYPERIARLAVLILVSGFAFILANNDVRMDALLTATSIFASWQLFEYCYFRKNKNLLLAALGLAGAMATKGLIGVVLPAIATFLLILQLKKYALFLDWKWLGMLLLFFVFLSPVLYAYWVQFDLHPELEIRGRTASSGIRFLLWEQSLERFQGGNFGNKGSDGPFFYLHTLLWALLPWSLLSYLAYFALLFQRKKSRYKADWPSLGTILLVMLLFSASGFKLPHYINILFPFIAISTSAYLLQTPRLKLLWRIQGPALLLITLILLGITGYIFPLPALRFLGLLPLIAMGVALSLKISGSRGKLIAASLSMGLLFSACMNLHLYPTILTYQAGTQLARQSLQRGMKQERIYFYEHHSYSFDFNTQFLHPSLSRAQLEDRLKTEEYLWLYTTPAAAEELVQQGYAVQQELAQPHFGITKLKPRFLNPTTRAASLRTDLLIAIRKANKGEGD